MEDTKIIDLFFARNEDAIAETDAAYGRKLFALSHRILNNQEDAEESVSDESLGNRSSPAAQVFLCVSCFHLPPSIFP